MKKTALLLPFLVLSLRLISQPCGCDPATEVVILHVNDMHARIDGMAKLAYLVDSIEHEHKNVFLVSAGDNFTGNPVVDMVQDKGYPMIDLMNRCGFDASVLGNHEFDMGQEFLAKRMRQARFPFVCCNIDASGGNIPQPPAYVLLKAGKCKVAFIGAIQRGESGLPDSHPSRFEGITFQDGVFKMKEYAFLKDDYRVVVALTHLGVQDDIRLAKEMPQIDLIVGGHSHSVIDTPLIVNGVQITQAGAHLKYVGMTKLHVEKGHIIFRKDTLLSLASVSGTKRGIQRRIDKYNENPELVRVVGTALKPFDNVFEIGAMMADAARASASSDFAFHNRGGVRIWSLPAGQITLKDIYRIDPFGNRLYVYKMNEAEIKSLIIYGYNLKNQADLIPSGLTYAAITDSSGRCIDVRILDNEGKPLDPATEYSVAMNSYIGASYTTGRRDKGLEVPATSAQAVIDYLSEIKSVDYQGVSRIQ